MEIIEKSYLKINELYIFTMKILKIFSIRWNKKKNKNSGKKNYWNLLEEFLNLNFSYWI
jgi:hypothetical protein